ncbi:hypothetical protein NHX12_016981, partial [Muraenolepis orangiensis]
MDREKLHIPTEKSTGVSLRTGNALGRHGAGTHRYNDTGCIYRSTWAHGKRNGAAVIVHANRRYEGTFINNQ